MLKRKWINSLIIILMALAVLATVLVMANLPRLRQIVASEEPGYVTEIFDKASVITIDITADEDDWQNMLDNATQEEYIACDVTINGKELINVAIRPKGNSSLSTVANSTSDRFSFKLEFDHYIDGQTLYGLDKMVVNNMQGDATWMKEYLSYDMMSYLGVDVPLYAYAQITVNGQPWGFYLAVEALEDSYAERCFGPDHGMLYKPESMGARGGGRMNDFIENGQALPGAQDSPNNTDEQQEQAAPPSTNGQDRGDGGGMDAGMSGNGVSLVYTDDSADSYSAIFENAVFDAQNSDYTRVIEAIKNLNDGTELEKYVDVDAVLKYFAAHNTVVSLDSYTGSMGHNYYLYEEDGRISILPWDYNLSFGGFQSSDASSVVNFPIDTPVSGVEMSERPLLNKLLEVPEYLEKYHEYLKQLMDGYFTSGIFEETIDSLDTLISGYVKEDPSAFYTFEEYEAAVPTLRQLGLLRAQSILGQLDGTIPSTAAGQQADSSALVAASSVNLQVLGSQGGGGAAQDGRQAFAGGEQAQGNPGGGPGGRFGTDAETMQKAGEIIGSSAFNDLTEDQLSALRELGLTDDQIERLAAMRQGGGGAPPGAQPDS